jgi:F-type H+-transporting ATPase subunit a
MSLLGTSRRLALAFALAGTSLAGIPAVAAAQHVDSATAPAAAADIITPHITDSYELEVPTLLPPFAKEVCVGHHDPATGECGPLWGNVKIGGEEIHFFGKPVNLSPTKHVVWMLIAAALACVVLIGAARAHRRHTHEVGRPKGFAAGIEAIVLSLRDEVAIRNLGHHGEGYAPFILTIFFFVLFANLVGLVPYGSTPTGNISVTATLALITLVVVEVAGIRAQGLGYLNTIFYWNKDLPLWLRIPMFVIMTPVEIVGKLSKPFALAIRLFANMTAGHVIVLAFIGMIFTFQSWLVTPGPVLMALAIMLLEVFVALLQAYIFTLLTSVFIGQLRVAHH